MGYAISSDGTNWETHPNNPLFESDPNGWDKDSVAGQVIVWDPIEKEYVMAYQGFTLGTGEIDWDTFETDNGTWGTWYRHLSRWYLLDQICTKSRHQFHRGL